jgi:hypothetical protein
MVWALTALLACTGRGPANQDSCELTSPPLLLAATSDFEVGALSAVDEDSACVADQLSSTWPDSLVRVREGSVFVLGRGTADAIRTYSDCCFSAPDREIPLPVGTNAHDLASVGDRWLVTAYTTNELLVLDTLGNQVGAIDVSAQADGDGRAEPDQIVVDGSIAYVALQALDEASGSPWAAKDGKVVAVDPATAAVGDVWSVGPDPKLYEHPIDSPRMVILTGIFGTPDGALELLDPDTGALTTEKTEAELGFDLYDYAETDGRGLVLGVDFASGSSSHLACIDWDTGTWKDGPTSVSWFDDVAAGPDGVFWVAARQGTLGTDSGLFRVDPVYCTILDEPWLEPSLEPYSIGALP